MSGFRTGDLQWKGVLVDLVDIIKPGVQDSLHYE